MAAPAPAIPVDQPERVPDRVGLLCTDMKDAHYLGMIVMRIRPDIVVDVILNRAGLDEWVERITPATRLIAFCTDIVVPEGVLSALGCPAYNYHPGSPPYPGRYPAAFAVYDGADRFGATLHRMHTRVDSGPISGVTDFPVPSGADVRWLEMRAHQAAVHLFLDSCHLLVNRCDPLPELATCWGERRCSRKALEALCTVAPDIDAEELGRRGRAITGLPDARLVMALHGRRYRLEPEAPTPAPAAP